MGRRIIFTVTNDLLFDQRMQRICGTMAAAGYTVTLVGRQKKSSLSPTPQPYQQIQLKHLLFTKGKLFYLEFNLRLLLFLLFKQFEAICSIDLDTVIPGLIVAKIKRKKHIFDAHELFTHVPEVARRKSVQAFWERVQKIAFKYTDVAFTVGPAIARYFEEHYNRKVGVVRNMPMSREIELSVKAESQENKPGGGDSIMWTSNHMEYRLPTKFILYQGALNEGRGLEYLLNAMPQIPCDLVLAGEGDLSDALRQTTLELGLTNKVHFLGMIQPTDLPLLTRLAYLGFNVSENAGLSYYLSLNNKFFDYTQSQLPSLINPYPEYKQLLSEFQVGQLTEATVDSIIKEANEMLQNENLYNFIKLQCIDAAKIWVWENETPELLSIFESAFDSNERIE